LNARQSPTIAAVLAIVFGAVNGQPPSTTLALPLDFVRILMESIGLGAREAGLNAMIARLKRYAAEAMTTIDNRGTNGGAKSEESPQIPSVAQFRGSADSHHQSGGRDRARVEGSRCSCLAGDTCVRLGGFQLHLARHVTQGSGSSYSSRGALATVSAHARRARTRRFTAPKSAHRIA